MGAHASRLRPGLLREWIARAAARDPDKPWIVCADGARTVTYGTLRDVTARIATVLHRTGLGRNDRVTLLANNSIEHLLCYLGTMAYGATICTVHVEMNRNQLDDIFARLKPKLVLHQDGLVSTTCSPPCLRHVCKLGHWTHPRPTRSSPRLRRARRAIPGPSRSRTTTR